MTDNNNPNPNPNTGKNSLPPSSFLWPLVMAAFGAWRIHVGTHSTVSLVWNIALIVLGVLFFLLLVVAKATGMTGEPAQVAKKIAANQRKLYGGLHEFRDATDADFRRLDRGFYDEVTRVLTAEGFRPVRDYVDVDTSNSWPRNLAVIRSCIGDSGATMAGVYHLRVYGLARMLQLIGVLPRRLKTLDCETELSDGTFVVTANTLETDKTLGYPFVDRLQLTKATPAAEIVRAHREHLNRVMATRPQGVVPLRCQSYDDLRASQDRLHLLKSAHRKSPDFDQHAEWQAMVGHPLRESDRELVDEVVREQRNG